MDHTSNNNIKKISNYLIQISSIQKFSQKISIYVDFFNYLVNDDNCIKILQDNDNFFNDIMHQLTTQLYGNIDLNKYNIIYNKLININHTKKCNYLDNGNNINTIYL